MYGLHGEWNFPIQFVEDAITVDIPFLGGIKIGEWNLTTLVPPKV